MNLSITEKNTRSQIILGHLEDINLNQRIDLEEYLETLTMLFYECRNKYIKAEADELEANELAMADVKSYIQADIEE